MDQEKMARRGTVRQELEHHETDREGRTNHTRHVPHEYCSFATESVEGWTTVMRRRQKRQVQKESNGKFWKEGRVRRAVLQGDKELFRGKTDNGWFRLYATASRSDLKMVSQSGGKQSYISFPLSIIPKLLHVLGAVEDDSRETISKEVYWGSSTLVISKYRARHSECKFTLVRNMAVYARIYLPISQQNLSVWTSFKDSMATYPNRRKQLSIPPDTMKKVSLDRRQGSWADIVSGSKSGQGT